MLLYIAVIPKKRCVIMKKVGLFLVVLCLFTIFTTSFSIGFVKPGDYDVDGGKIDSFAKLMPGQELDISMLSSYNGEIISNVNLSYDKDKFEVGKINYGNPFIDIYFKVKDDVIPGNYKLTFYITTNKGEVVIDSYIQISTKLLKGQLFFVGNVFNLHDNKEIKIIVENQSDGKTECELTSNLSKSWIPYKTVEIKPKEVIEISNVFIANNVGTYDILLSCDNSYGNQFKLEKNLKVITTRDKEDGFMYFAYPVINNILMPFYSLVTYISELY